MERPPQPDSDRFSPICRTLILPSLKAAPSTSRIKYNELFSFPFRPSTAGWDNYRSRERLPAVIAISSAGWFLVAGKRRLSDRPAASAADTISANFSKLYVRLLQSWSFSTERRRRNLVWNFWITIVGTKNARLEWDKPGPTDQRRGRRQRKMHELTDC